MLIKFHHTQLEYGYSCNKGLIALITSTGKVNSTLLRLVQLVSLPLLDTRAINPIYCTLNHTINYANQIFMVI